MPILAERIKSRSERTVIQNPARKRRRCETTTSCISIFNSLWMGLSNTYESSRKLKRGIVSTHAKYLFLSNEFFSSKRDSFCNNDLFQCLLYGNKKHDSASWVVAFTLIQRLLLDSQQIHDDFVSTAFHPDYSIHFLFTMYCISFKWHLDYSVALDYLVDILPFSNDIKEVILCRTSLVEQKLLAALDFQCNVSYSDLLCVLRKYLIPSDCEYLIQTLTE